MAGKGEISEKTIEVRVKKRNWEGLDLNVWDKLTSVFANKDGHRFCDTGEVQLLPLIVHKSGSKIFSGSGHTLQPLLLLLFEPGLRFLI